MGTKRIAALIAAGLAAAANVGLQAVAQDAPNKTCTCRAKGHDYPFGAIVCLPSPTGPQLARCGVFLNNTSWQFTGQSCVISMPQSVPMLRLAAHDPRQ